MNDEFASLAYSAGWTATRLMPEFLAYRSFDLIADQFWLTRGKAVKQFEANLARVVPGLSQVEMRELSRKGVRSYMRYWCDTFRLPTWSHDRIFETVVCEGEDVLREALADGGAILSLPHSGNWDHAGAWAALKGFKVATVAEKLRPESLFQQFLTYRESLGMSVFPLDQSVMLPLMRRLKEGALVALVADRDITDHGIPVKFFGHHTTMPPGPAALAVQMGRPLLPTFVSYDKNIIRLKFSAPLARIATNSREVEIARLTQECAHFFEREIAKAPWDWHMFQPLWSDDR